MLTQDILNIISEFVSPKMVNLVGDIPHQVKLVLELCSIKYSRKMILKKPFTKYIEYDHDGKIIKTKKRQVQWLRETIATQLNLLRVQKLFNFIVQSENKNNSIYSFKQGYHQVYRDITRFHTHLTDRTVHKIVNRMDESDYLYYLDILERTNEIKNNFLHIQKGEVLRGITEILIMIDKTVDFELL